MSDRHKKAIRVNLEVEPSALSECARQNPNHCFTLGDLHANSLKLLHFLMLHGAAQMGQKGDYARFVKIYNKKNDKLRQQDLAAIEDIIDRIKITPTARIRLLGDEICDRGSNDYFIFLLLEKLIQGTRKQGRVEILMSNHGHSFIQCHENYHPYDENQLSNVWRSQGVSAINLQSLIGNAWVNQSRINELYDLYKTTLKAISYEVNAQGEISSIYTHAPMGENDIYKMGLGIEKYALEQFTRDLFPEGLGERMTTLLNAIRARKNKRGIPSKYLAELIDLINQIVAYNAEHNTLNDLVEMGPPLSEKQINGSGLDAEAHPFYMLLWNRDPRNDARLNSKRICPIHYVHGHDPGETNKNLHRKSHDNTLGKGPNWHVGTLGYSCTDPTEHPLTEPYVEAPEDPYNQISLLSVPVVGASMTGAMALEKPIGLIPYTDGIALDVFILPYLTGKLTYWMNYGLRMLFESGDTDPRVIAKDSANLQWQVTLGMGGMEAATHLPDLIIYGLNHVGMDIANNFFNTSFSLSTELVKGCPMELKGAMMFVSALGFAVGATVAKWHQSKDKIQGLALYTELALTFSFGFIIGAAAAIGYKNEVAQYLMPAATTAVLMMGVHNKWMPTPPTVPEVIQEAPKNGDPLFSTQQESGYTQR